jgi:hypothetical protein
MVFADAAQAKKRLMSKGMIVEEDDLALAIFVKLKSPKHGVILQRCVCPGIAKFQARCIQIIVREIEMSLEGTG